MLGRIAITLVCLAVLAGLCGCKKDEATGTTGVAPPTSSRGDRTGAAEASPAETNVTDATEPESIPADGSEGAAEATDSDGEADLQDAVAEEIAKAAAGDPSAAVQDLKVEGDAKSGSIKATTPMGAVDVGYNIEQDDSITAESMGLKAPKGSRRVSGMRNTTDMGALAGGAMGTAPPAKAGAKAAESKMVTEAAVYECPVSPDEAISFLRNAFGDKLVDGSWMIGMAGGMAMGTPDAPGADQMAGFFMMVDGDDVQQVMVVKADSANECTLMLSRITEAPPMFMASLKQLALMGKPPAPAAKTGR